MHCGSCGTNLPPGAAVCPVCGVPTPYNISQAPSPGAPQYQPTVPATPYDTPMPLQSSNDPTYISSPYGGASSQSAPPTNYGSPPYNPSQQNPYAAPPVNPYGAPVPQDPYSVPVQPYPGGFPPPVQPPKRRSRIGLIIGIVVLVLVLACVGSFVALGLVAKNAVTNVTATLTATVPTPGTTQVTQGTAPSGLQIDPSAAAILTNPQMASAIDPSTDIPTKLSTTFAVKQTIYVTFGINTGGSSGYAVAKWYSNGTFGFASKILTVQSNFDHGYFSAYFNIPTNGTVELYWCTQSNCSDAKLAGFTTFTVTAASSYTGDQPAVTIRNMDQRV
jgi:hypothetical protein